MKVEIITTSGSKQTYENVDHISSTQSTTILSSSNKTIATIYNESILSLSSTASNFCHGCINYKMKL